MQVELLETQLSFPENSGKREEGNKTPDTYSTISERKMMLQKTCYAKPGTQECSQNLSNHVSLVTQKAFNIMDAHHLFLPNHG